ncbi:hypothetical protein KP509_27G042500 [Ceratopteris richardii]|uniref:Uncharacterized protein n=2 Tax=Ceratopteris richardii TaxID=49495 RepID=A0A8T2RIB4_CERRI|nr:hypothetical protein KP509_27G042500 [Ceratopteris richardii]
MIHLKEVKFTVMASEWDFSQYMQNLNATQKNEYSELYKRAREATEEAERQGNAELKAAIAAGMSGMRSPRCIGSLSSNFGNLRLEATGCQTSTLSSEKSDIVPIVFQFLMRTALICLIFQTRTDLTSAFSKGEFGVLNLSTGKAASLWVAVLCAAMLIVPFQSTGWCGGDCGLGLMLAFSVLWLGEVVVVLVSSWHLTLDIAHICSQCIFSSILHRAPFSSHLKARLFGFGFQTIMALAIVSKIDNALPAVLYFSLSHSLGIALAYMSQRSIQSFILDKKFTDLQVSSLQARKRALGGFAGGFAGVSSLKYPYPSSMWPVSACSYGSSWRGDHVSEVSCSSSSTIDNHLDHLPSEYFFPPLSSSDRKFITTDIALQMADSGCEVSK